LSFVSEAWDLAAKVEEETRMLGFHGVINLQLSQLDDKPSLRARCTLLGTATSTNRSPENAPQNSSSRIDVDFAVTTRILDKKDETEIGVLDIHTEVLASKVYGFGTDNDAGLSEKEMRSILSKELKGHGKSGVKLGSGVWSKAVQMLSGKAF
jgi:kinetochore protein Spc7/SPC105